jgi:MFS family permease
MFVIGSFFPTFVDRVGRRAPMMWGSFGLGFCMMMVSILLGFKGKANEHATSSASVAIFFLYMLLFGASVNCIPRVYVPDILPLHARAKGTAVGISSNWTWVSPCVLSLITLVAGLLQTEFLRRHDHTHHRQPAAVEGLPDIYVHELCFRAICIFLLSGNSQFDTGKDRLSLHQSRETGCKNFERTSQREKEAWAYKIGSQQCRGAQ